MSAPREFQQDDDQGLEKFPGICDECRSGRCASRRGGHAIGPPPGRGLRPSGVAQTGHRKYPIHKCGSRDLGAISAVIGMKAAVRELKRGLVCPSCFGMIGIQMKPTLLFLTLC